MTEDKDEDQLQRLIMSETHKVSMSLIERHGMTKSAVVAQKLKLTDTDTGEEVIFLIMMATHKAADVLHEVIVEFATKTPDTRSRRN